MRSRHGAVSGKRGKEKDEPAVCGEGSGDGDKRVKGFCSVKRRGEAAASLWFWLDALRRLKGGWL
jgi:hypothetical protein